MNRIQSRWFKNAGGNNDVCIGSLTRKFLAALGRTMMALALVTAATSGHAGDILFVSDTTTDSQNIPSVLTTGGHNVTVIVNDYMVTGGTFGLAEGTNTALANTDLGIYCAVFWSASGPHEPDGFNGGLGADGGLHNAPTVFANLNTYVGSGGFVFVTGHDAAANPDDPLLAEFIAGTPAGGVAVLGQELRTRPHSDPFVAFVQGGNALSDGVTNITGATPGVFVALRTHPNGALVNESVPGGVNLLDGVQDLDAVVTFDSSQTSVVVEEPRMPGAGMWTVRTPSGTADHGEFVNIGHVAYVANGVFLYEDLPANPGVFLSNGWPAGEDRSWLPLPDGDPVYNAALLNFAHNSCISLPYDAAKTPIADDKSVSTPLSDDIDITLTGSDPNGDPITFSIVSEPAFGTVDKTNLPMITYTPNGVFTGDAILTFVVSDGTRTSDPGTVTIAVLPNLPPAADAGGPYVVNEGDSVALDGSGSSDPDDGDVLTYEWDLDNDGVFETPGQTPAFDASGLDGPSDIPVALKVTDIAGATDVDTSVVSVLNVAPSVAADNATVTKNEGQTASNTGTFSDPGADTVTVTASVGILTQVGTQSGTWSWMYGTSDGPDDSQTVTITAGDGEGGVSTTTFDLFVLNVPPVASDDVYGTNEDTPLIVAAPGVLEFDTDVPTDPLTASVTTGPSNGVLVLNGNGSFTYTPDFNWFGTDSFVYTAMDDDGATDTATVTINVAAVNDPPTLSVNIATQTIQYSDGISPVTITAADVDNVLPALSLSNLPVALPDFLSVSGGACVPDNVVPAGTGSNCTWTLSGDIGVGAGNHPMTFTVTDGGGLNASAGTTVVVVQEDATAMLDEDNDVAVMVDEPGSDSSLAFSLTVFVTETSPDQAVNSLTAAGDIGLANVSMSLAPVGPGGSHAGSCGVPTVSGAGYLAVKTVTCNFSGVPVSTYSVNVTVDGAFYTGSGEDVLTVYDPSLGFATGGGWFYWPGTLDKTNYGFTMKFGRNGRNVKGSLLLIRHQADGSNYRFKSNALEGLAVGDNESPAFVWASFSGKGTYREPGWPDPIGNHKFTTYVEDRGEPGSGVDRVWIETRDRDNLVLPGLSMSQPATTNATTINGGNIVVPHTTGNGKK